MSAALELEDAQAKLLALATRMPVEQVHVAEAAGRYLAADLIAERTQPPTDLSAMDGYAIGAGQGPWRLIGESRAGNPFAGTLEHGETVRISTGAEVPQGADRILIQEDAQVEDGDTVSAVDLPASGQHVRRRGFDFSEGDRVLESGTRIGPAQVALALSAGHAKVPVRRAPLVAVLDCGDELCADPAHCAPGQIPASNGAMLEAVLRPLGCEVMRIGPVADDLEALARALELAQAADILITSGGASVGDHDLIKPALEQWSAQLAFWRVAIKPGKPLLVATRGKQVILGLPGNPVSSYVTCFLFGLPLVRASLGASEALPRKVTVRAGCELSGGGVRREFLRAFWDGECAVPVDQQDSSALASLARANCLIERRAGADAVAGGTPIVVYPLEIGGIA